MAADINLRWTNRQHPTEENCPVRFKYQRIDGQTSRQTRCSPMTQDSSVSVGGVIMVDDMVAMETNDSSEDELGRLDIDLDRKSKQHNLTTSNVRTILHEVITHEHVVAMMKAAIRDTQDLPMFEPKMTRSRLKQAVQQGQPVNWSLSEVNTVKPPQFVDIDLEDDEDSSDEEYCPDEEEEEEEDTAEETFLSDADCLASPLRTHHNSQSRLPADQRTDGPLQRPPGPLREHVMTSTSADSSFLERLNAVEEELDYSPTYTFDQSLDRKPAADDDVDEEGCLAYRTRSKLRLVNIPLGQLEAELLAPDITADMYDLTAKKREEDRHWMKWLQGLMAPDNEEEAEDDDDPEYNFLDDMDEPDVEDYRTDRAVQITKREVNELLEELFVTLQEEEEVEQGEGREEDVEQEEDGAPSQTGPKFNVPQALCFAAPLASMLTERRQTVRKQYEALQQRRALQDSTNHHRDDINRNNTTSTQSNTTTPVLVLPCHMGPAFHLDLKQKLQLQQQIQQHVQLLIQVHLLSCHVDALNHEACITKHYLEELQQFSSRQEQMFQRSSFRVCNLQGALDLLQEVTQREEPRPAAAAPAATRRLLPQMTPATNSHAFPLLPANLAWLFATRPVFLYPELLPVCSLDPTLHSQNPRSIYTAGEDGLIVLGLKHFEGAVQSDQLISSYLLCKNRWNIKKHIREMSSPRAAPNNIIKMFLTQRVVPHLPLACSRVQPGDQRPPVDKNVLNVPNWLKNSQQIIQKTQLDSNCYPPTLPLGCTLRLHPYWLNKTSRPPHPHHRRLFTLAHNASLLPLAKAPDDRQVDKPANGQVDMQPITCLSLPPPSVPLRSDSPTAHAALPLAPPPACRAVALAAAHSVPAQSVCNDITWRCPRLSPRTQKNTPVPVVLPFASPLPSPSAAVMQPGFFLLQMMLPADISQHAQRKQFCGPIREAQEEVPLEEESAAPMLSPPLKQEGGGWVGPGGKEQVNQEEANQTNMGLLSLNGGENTVGEDEDGRKGGGAEGDGRGEAGGGQEGDQGGEAEQQGEEEGQRQEGGGDKEEDGEKDKDEDQDRPGEEEEEEDFDDLTQDEDEEEVMSSASEESVLSVPELQETMKQLTWLAAERRLCADADSEEDHSPTSPGSQEEEEEEEEEGPKGEESEEGRSSKAGGDEETPSGEGAPRGVRRCPGRGRGRSRPLRGLRRSRQERRSKDATKLLLLFDENLLDNDPHRESKDVAFAQSYLSRVREALQDVPGQVEQFVSLLNEFEQAGEGREVVSLFRKLRCILGDRADLLRDFAAFLHPEQALQCGLWEEQQAFERSRRFLRQLEISFGDNPSHYQKIIKALQTGPDLSPACIHELKGQMATLLKGHTHLQTEFWVFFDELRPPPARPGQFEEAQWPEEGGCMLDSGDSIGQLAGGGASGGFEEVTLPELEEEDEGHKIQPMTSRRKRRKMNAHINYKDCDWLDKEWPCPCRDVKIRRHKRKGCSRCHSNKTSGGVSRAIKSLDPLYSQISSTSCEQGDKYLDLKGDDDSPQPDRSAASWEGSFRLTDDKEEEEELDDDEDDEEEEERRNTDKEQSPAVKRSRREEALQPLDTSTYVPLPSTWTPSSSDPRHSSISPSTSSSVPCSTSTSSSSVTSSIPTSTSVMSSSSSSSAPPRSSLPLDLPVCAKNISLTASGEKVILWTREADRVILTTCQQEGANHGTFQSISTLLGNKTPAEVSRRFRDLMRLFRTAARQNSSEDEAPPAEQTAADEEED